MIRIGQGMDVHALVADRPLILGGVEIDWHLGLDGHSDADVLLHAVVDAVLGALGKGDIGRHFPPSDERYRGMDSREFVREAARLMARDHWQVGNIDCTVVAQRPRLAPHLGNMEANIAADLGTRPERVNVKATTTEGLGFCGREEGIQAFAVVLLVKKETGSQR